MAVILLLVTSAAASAQQIGDYFFGFGYNVSVPISDMKDFTDGTSFRGVNMEFRKIVRPNVTVGFMAGWHVFDERTDEVVSLDVADIQGTQLRYINSFPLMVNAHYYFGDRGGVRPFIGANVGTYYIERRVEIGLFLVDDDAWHFGLAPEAGIVVPIGWRARGFLNARYNWAIEASDFTGNYWSFSIGAAWQ